MRFTVDITQTVTREWTEGVDADSVDEALDKVREMCDQSMLNPEACDIVDQKRPFLTCMHNDVIHEDE